MIQVLRDSELTPRRKLLREEVSSDIDKMTTNSRLVKVQIHSIIQYLSRSLCVIGTHLRRYMARGH